MSGITEDLRRNACESPTHRRCSPGNSSPAAVVRHFHSYSNCNCPPVAISTANQTRRSQRCLRADRSSARRSHRPTLSATVLWPNRDVEPPYRPFFARLPRTGPFGLDGVVGIGATWPEARTSIACPEASQIAITSPATPAVVRASSARPARRRSTPARSGVYALSEARWVPSPALTDHQDDAADDRADAWGHE